jgi:hypothetical protein
LGEDQYTFLIISRSFLLRMKNVLCKLCGENRNTHFLFFRKTCLSSDNVEKYCRAGQQTADSNMAHAHCMMDTQGYKHTLRLCTTYCSSTTTMVVQKCFNVTLYVHCLSCLMSDLVVRIVTTRFLQL